MNPNAVRRCLVFLAGWPLAATALAQSPRVGFPAASPACTLRQRVGLTDIEISYSRPGVKGRPVFGGIVPYGQVWRTGANASTKISFSTPVKLDGHPVPAGKYALYTIPGEDRWTIILSRNTRLWGAFGYDPKDDQVRFQVAPRDFDPQVETFTIGLNDIRDDSAILYLLWDHTAVPMRLQLEVTDTVLPQIAAAMAAPGKKPAGFYFQAATFYYDHGQDLNQALAWVNAALDQHTHLDYELLHLKAQILARQGDKAGAIAAAKQSSDLALKAEGPATSFVQMNRDLISSLR